MSYPKFSYDSHIDRKTHITAHKKSFVGNTGVHFHEFFEIEIAIDGEGRFMLNGEEGKIKRGVGYIMTPADFHLLDGNEDFKLYNIMFDGSIVDEKLISLLYDEPVNRSFYLDEEEFTEISFLIEMIIEESNSDAFNRDDVIRSLLQILITRLLRKKQTEDREEALGGSVNDAIRYIYTNLRQKLPLNEVAAVCNYSPAYFSRLFYELTGKGYVDFVNDLRLDCAKRLLSCSDMTINEIALECGFASISNFYRVFKKEMNLTPTQYRESEKKYET